RGVKSLALRPRPSAPLASNAPLLRGLLAPSALRFRAFSMIVHESPHPEVEIPKKTIWEIVEEQASVNGDKTAFICGLTHDRITFGELYESARRLAVALAQDGVGKGDVHVTRDDECGVHGTDALTTSLLRLFFSELSKRDFDSFNFEKIDPELNVMLPFSSGTTGIPKGVALSARNMLSNALQVDQVEDLAGYSLGLLPFFHIYGMMLLHLSLYQGAAKVILPRFDPETFLNALSVYKIRAAHIAPPVALFLAHHPLVEKYDLSATEFLVSGGAPMGKEVEALVKDRLKVTVKQAYGMTEASPAVNYAEDGYPDLYVIDYVERVQGSVGRLLPNTQLRVKCTSTDVDLPVGEHGELLYKGPQVMIGYSNNVDANKNVFTEDRFLRTGDIGYIDEDGFVFVVDRVKELIKYKGHQVAPAELEDVLNNHPQISDACCVRGQDAFGQEIPKAYVVLKDPTNAAKLTKEDVMDFVASKVAPFKKVREVEFIGAIPKSATGKILRRELQVHENKNHTK
ncbi:hypothetical protein BBJ28_00018720, partial [Nothophytophthora sp. Chile5]